MPTSCSVRHDSLMRYHGRYYVNSTHYDRTVLVQSVLTLLHISEVPAENIGLKTYYPVRGCVVLLGTSRRMLG
jgi:hypothetical protein